MLANAEENDGLPSGDCEPTSVGRGDGGNGEAGHAGREKMGDGWRSTPLPGASQNEPHLVLF